MSRSARREGADPTASDSVTVTLTSISRRGKSRGLNGPVSVEIDATGYAPTLDLGDTTLAGEGVGEVLQAVVEETETEVVVDQIDWRETTGHRLAVQQVDGEVEVVAETREKKYRLQVPATARAEIEAAVLRL